MAQEVERVLGKEKTSKKHPRKKLGKMPQKGLCCYGSVGRALPW